MQSREPEMVRIPIHEQSSIIRSVRVGDVEPQPVLVVILRGPEADLVLAGRDAGAERFVVHPGALHREAVGVANLHDSEGLHVVLVEPSQGEAHGDLLVVSLGVWVAFNQSKI